MPKVTIQDIANELGLSRNTVSKALNNKGLITDSTRDAILKKAAEMGYKLFAFQNTMAKENASVQSEKKELVLLTGTALGSLHFAAKMLDEMQTEALMLGYGFTMYRVMPQEREELRLPVNFDAKRVAGIFCVEMFDTAYSQMLCSLGIPILFIDTAVNLEQKPLAADLLLMENRSGIYTFIKEMVSRGQKDFGFVGEALHCMSFYERYDAFMGAIRLFGMEYHPEWCFTGNSHGINYPSHSDYIAYLEDKFSKCESFPSVLICANDFVAMDVIQVLKKIGKSVPQDVLLCGFDDSPESRIINPSLTTIHIKGQAMGSAAINLLFSRIKNPDSPFRTLYIETNIVYRESTEGY